MWMDFGTGVLPRTPFATALGKAMALCQNFESNCKQVAMVQQLGIGIESGDIKIFLDPDWMAFVEKLTKMSLGRNIQTIRGSEDKASILNEGRKSRNFIAHQAGLAICLPIEDLHRYQLRVQYLLKHVEQVAEADNIVSKLSYEIEMKEPAPEAYGDRYVRRCVNWVSLELNTR